MEIIILIVIGVCVFIAYKRKKDKDAEVAIEGKNVEEKKKTEEVNNRAKYEVLTDTEKKSLSAISEDLLKTTLNAFKLAQEGNDDAMLLIGLTYQSKLKNSQKAFYWVQKASNKGNAEGKYWLGEFYVSGYGVSQNKTQGMSLIMDAARKGNKRAFESLKEVGMTASEMKACGIPIQ